MIYLAANSRYSAASYDGGLGMSGILSQGLLTSPQADRPTDTTLTAQTHSLGCLVGGPILQLLSTKMHHFLYNLLAEEQFPVLHRDNFTFLLLTPNAEEYFTVKLKTTYLSSQVDLTK
jgi:hypothetical protein